MLQPSSVFCDLEPPMANCIDRSRGQCHLGVTSVQMDAGKGEKIRKEKKGGERK